LPKEFRVEALKLHADSIPKTREELVTDCVREAILRGDFKPGERLDENAIASHLGVSRTPVRAAFRILAAESLVEVQRHRGTVVNELSPDELEEIYLIRGILEGALAHLAAPRMDEERIAALQAILEEMEMAPNTDQWLALNNHFHRTIYQAANRPRMLSIIAYVRNIAVPYIRQFIDSPKRMASSRDEHRQILAACVERDGALAQEVVERHLKAVCEANLEYVESEQAASVTGPYPFEPMQKQTKL
jgi:DNA-binding GntR family transcriptional regulator